jgi:hypothetical protein
MTKYYFTFGQGHRHEVNGVIYDHNCVVEIEAEDSDKAREKMFSVFGDKWSMQYESISNHLEYFPRGIIRLE